MRLKEIVGWREKPHFRKRAGFKGLVFRLLLPKINEFIQNPTCPLDELQCLGLYYLEETITGFVSRLEGNKVYQIEAFNSVALESTDIIHAASDFHGKPMFSNISVTGEAGMPWYALVGFKYL